MRPYLKFLTLLGLILSTSLVQAQQSNDTDRLDRAERELIELKSTDKSSLTQREAKELRLRKQYLRRVIAQERERLAFQQAARNPWIYGSPYFNGRFGYDPYWNRGGYYNRPPVVIVRPPVNNCPPYQQQQRQQPSRRSPR
ncbi:MAG: hypothetical protein EAZ89_06540 [Bacteroidetes bacterium]|nr:MAG: hypothetical protein EAZ89_06540 [Bacteroidota bacterium]